MEVIKEEIPRAKEHKSLVRSPTSAEQNKWEKTESHEGSQYQGERKHSKLSKKGLHEGTDSVTLIAGNKFLSNPEGKLFCT